jgi:O-antigen ligase
MASIGFPAMLCADSEGGFLGLVPLMIILLIYYIRDTEKLRDYFILVTLMLICGKLLLLFGKGKGFGTMQSLFVESNIAFVLIGISLLIALALYFINRKLQGKLLPKAVQTVGICVALAVLLMVICLVIYFTFIDRTTKLNSIMGYLRFGEKWGTHRGYMWIKSFEIFGSAGILTKLFGTGLDTFYSAFAPYFNELNEKFSNTSTNCAHNEFLNYLITIGIAGLSAYLVMVISIVIRAFKKAKSNYLALVFGSAIVCYLLQSFVNIAQPITTPLLFIFIALAENICRNKTSE